MNTILHDKWIILRTYKNILRELINKLESQKQLGYYIQTEESQLKKYQFFDILMYEIWHKALSYIKVFNGDFYALSARYSIYHLVNAADGGPWVTSA